MLAAPSPVLQCTCAMRMGVGVGEYSKELPEYSPGEEPSKKKPRKKL